MVYLELGCLSTDPKGHVACVKNEKNLLAKFVHITYIAIAKSLRTQFRGVENKNVEGINSTVA